jgi:hypothetical protein
MPIRAYLTYIGFDIFPDEEKKVQVINYLDTLRFRHRYIFSASANEYSNREAYKKQQGISVIPISGGLSPVR